MSRLQCIYLEYIKSVASCSGIISTKSVSSIPFVLQKYNVPEQVQTALPKSSRLIIVDIQNCIYANILRFNIYILNLRY